MVLLVTRRACFCADVHPEPAKCVGARALGMTGRSLLNILADTASIVRDYRSRPVPLPPSLQAPSLVGGLGPLPFPPAASSAAAVLAGAPARRQDAGVPSPDVPGDAAAPGMGATPMSPVPPPAPEVPVVEEGAAGAAPGAEKIDCAPLMREVHIPTV